ncbi:Nif3-like dinuclear metal center hexameric protein [Shigella flexneri]
MFLICQYIGYRRTGEVKRDAERWDYQQTEGAKMKNTELEQLINEKLNSAAISDYAPNGLQVEGKETCKPSYRCHRQPGFADEAVRLGADAVIVHHGYFWKGESPADSWNEA